MLYSKYDHLEALRNFMPNRDGTYGPHHWDEKTLCDWADEDLKRMKRSTRIEVTLGAVAIILIIGLCFYT